jgi:arylsulfatase A-like enzyme
MDMATTMDLLPTFCSVANVDLPNDRIYDGYDISPVLFGTGPDPRNVVFYYRGTQVAAIRKGDFKAHFFTQLEFGPNKTDYDPPLLYNLSVDPSEKFNIAEEHPDVIAEIKKILAEHLSTLVPVDNQLEK